MDQIWGAAFLVPFLALVTLLGLIVVALVMQAKTRERRRDPNAPKSTLAADATDHTRSGEGVE